MGPDDSITKGEQMFIKGYVERGFEIIQEGANSEQMVARLSIQDAIGADTAARRLLARHPRQAIEDILCMAGSKVSRMFLAAALKFGHSAESVSVLLPAFWAFEAMFCSLFLVEVARRKIVLGSDEEYLRFIAEETYEAIPSGCITLVIQARENELVRAEPIIVSDEHNDLYRYLSVPKILQ